MGNKRYHHQGPRKWNSSYPGSTPPPSVLFLSWSLHCWMQEGPDEVPPCPWNYASQWEHRPPSKHQVVNELMNLQLKQALTRWIIAWWLPPPTTSFAMEGKTAFHISVVISSMTAFVPNGLLSVAAQCMRLGLKVFRHSPGVAHTCCSMRKGKGGKCVLFLLHTTTTGTGRLIEHTDSRFNNFYSGHLSRR